jgi:hypothetical protein
MKEERCCLIFVSDLCDRRKINGDNRLPSATRVRHKLSLFSTTVLVYSTRANFKSNIHTTVLPRGWLKMKQLSEQVHLHVYKYIKQGCQRLVHPKRASACAMAKLVNESTHRFCWHSKHCRLLLWRGWLDPHVRRFTSNILTDIQLLYNKESTLYSNTY